MVEAGIELNRYGLGQNTSSSPQLEMLRKAPLLRLAPLGLIILALSVVACGNADTPSLEEQAYSIDRSLICPVCPGETIDQAQVELAAQMREIVRERLAAGWSREQILQFFVDRYGERVLAAPPKKGFNLVAWVVPIAVGVGARVILLAFVVRAMRRAGHTRQDDGPVSEQELEPYLSLVDQDLGLSRGSAHEPEKDD